MSGVATMSASEFKMDCAIGIGIFRATKPDGTVVAVKLINRALPRVESTRKHLESLLAENLVHENLSRILQVFQHDAFLWIVSEYAEFGSVKTLLAVLGTGLSEDDAIAVWGQAANGLAFLHRAQFLHRDVCAQNIVVSSGGEAKLAGTLMVAVADTSRDLLGSLTHAAPDVVWGTDYGFACDVWSLGITLMELVNGAAPHESLSPPLRIVQAIVHGDMPEPFPTLSASNAQLLRSCLARDPSLRPSSSSVVAELKLPVAQLRERVAAFVLHKKLPDARASFAAAHPGEVELCPPNYVAAAVLSPVVQPIAMLVEKPADKQAPEKQTLAQEPKQQLSDEQVDVVRSPQLALTASPLLAHVSSLPSGVVGAGTAAGQSTSHKNKKIAEPQLVAINSNSDVSPQLDRIPVVLPSSALEAKRKVSSAFTAYQTPVDAAGVQQPESPKERSSEVKKIGKFTVTTTTPTAGAPAASSSGAPLAAAPGLTKQRSFVTTQGKFTVTTTQLVPATQGAAAQQHVDMHRVLEMLLLEQREMARTTTEILKEMRSLREENAALKAAVQLVLKPKQ